MTEQFRSKTHRYEQSASLYKVQNCCQRREPVRDIFIYQWPVNTAGSVNMSENTIKLLLGFPKNALQAIFMYTEQSVHMETNSQRGRALENRTLCWRLTRDEQKKKYHSVTKDNKPMLARRHTHTEQNNHKLLILLLPAHTCSGIFHNSLVFCCLFNILNYFTCKKPTGMTDGSETCWWGLLHHHFKNEVVVWRRRLIINTNRCKRHRRTLVNVWNSQLYVNKSSICMYSVIFDYFTSVFTCMCGIYAQSCV